MDIKKVPNVLTVIRAILVPVFMVLVIFPIIPGETALRIVGASLFLAISLTDMLDGQIARKYNAVSDFGKFLDPIADKLLVMGGMLSLVIFYMDRLHTTFAILIAFSLFIVMVRELAVTSLRLICKNTGGKVIAANMAGKVKTVSQIVFIIAALIETPLFNFIADLTGLDFLYGSLWVSYAALAVMTFMTVYSGIQYFVLYLPMLKDKKD
ncbi:MAG: CDP-diacylglycerol--glycerol-3-phosphate 3-phosphatidyltransferase [Clostridia bacterium]|nr:CDP-diacylglycerol--glycerol-3-phosphate 3-phosphatidyltransferase [Clostridia bacterium]